MTLNGHFAVKSNLFRARYLMGWRSAFRAKFADLCIYCQRQKCSAGSQVTGDISFMGLFAGRWGSVKRERQVKELYSQLSHMLLTDVYRK